MKKLNILQVVNSPHWHAISSYALGLSKRLKDKGHKVILVTLPDSLLLKRAKAEGLNVVTNLRLSHYNPFYFITDLGKMIKLLTEEEVDILNVHESQGFIISCLAAKLVKRPIALIRTRGTFMAPKGHFINRYLHNSLTDKVIITSKFMRNICLKHLRGKEDHYQLIYGGVDIDNLIPTQIDLKLKESLGIEKDALIIGIIARFDPVKGYRYFFEAAGKVKSKIEELRLSVTIKLLVIGYEAEFNTGELLTMAENYGVKKETIIIKEWCDLRKILSVIDIGVISSVGSEANSRVLLEYMACGKPVVATKVGVIPEVIEDDKTGYLVLPKQPEIMAEKIVDLLENEEKRSKMGFLARKLVEEKFNEKDLVAKTEKIYYQAKQRIG